MKKALAISAIILVCLVLVFLVARNHETQNAPQGKPIVKIGMILPLSGDAAAMGKAAQNAAALFMEDLKKKDTKYDYVLIWEDNGFHLNRSVLVAKKLISFDKADALVTLFSNIATVVKPVADESKILQMSISTDKRTADGIYNFAIGTSAQQESAAFLKELEKRSIKTVDAILVNISGVQLTWDTFKKLAEQAGTVKIRNVYTINPGERDFDMMITKIMQNPPDAIVAQVIMPEIDILMRRFKEKGNKIPVTGMENFSYLENKHLADGLWYVDVATSVGDFAARYKAKTGEADTHYSELTYAALQVLVDGYEKAASADKKPTSEAVAAAINQHKQFKTVMGATTLDDHGMMDTNATVKEVMDGKASVIGE